MPRRNDDAKYAILWTPQGHRGRGEPKNAWKRDKKAMTAKNFMFIMNFSSNSSRN